MKHLTYLLNSVLAVLLISSILFAQEELEKKQNLNLGDMIVKIDNIESDEGVIMLALYVGEDNYAENRTFNAAKVSITESVAEYTFENVPFGEYAIKCYHDENENSKLDTNMFGIPSEGYGFSNNATGNFGPADYEDAEFKFETNQQVVEISIQ